MAAKKKTATKTEKKAEEKPRPRRLLVYIGVRAWLKGNKHGHVYLPVEKGWQDEPPPEPDVEAACIWGKPIVRFGRPGKVFTIEHEEGNEGRVFIGTDDDIGSYPNEVCVAWESESRAIESAKRIETEAKKDGARDIALEELEPFQRAYKRLRNKNERAVFLGRLIDYVTRGSGL